jgi:hypothetical protein
VFAKDIIAKGVGGVLGSGGKAGEAHAPREAKLRADVKRWLFILLMLLWLAVLPFIALGFGFAGFRLEAVAMLMTYLALPAIAHAVLMRSGHKPVEPMGE